MADELGMRPTNIALDKVESKQHLMPDSSPSMPHKRGNKHLHNNNSKKKKNKKDKDKTVIVETAPPPVPRDEDDDGDYEDDDDELAAHDDGIVEKSADGAITFTTNDGSAMHESGESDAPPHQVPPRLSHPWYTILTLLYTPTHLHITYIHTT